MSDTQSTIAWVLTIITVPLPLLSWYLSISICRRNKVIGIKTIKCAAIYGSICFSLAVTLLLPSMYLYNIGDIASDATLGLFLNSLSALVYYHGRCCLNYIFIGRLYYSFNDTVLAYSNTLIYILLILVTINLLSLTFVGFSWYICSVCAFPVAMLNLLFDITLPIILSILFIKKLNSFSKMSTNGLAPPSRTTRTISAHSVSSTTDVSTTDQYVDKQMTKINDERNFGNQVIRYTILTIFAAISSWLSAVFVFILFSKNAEVFDAFQFYLWELIISWDSAINIICLFFYFKFSTSLYGKICGKCHRCCLSIYVKKARRNDSQRKNSSNPENIEMPENTPNTPDTPNTSNAINIPHTPNVPITPNSQNNEDNEKRADITIVYTSNVSEYKPRIKPQKSFAGIVIED